LHFVCTCEESRRRKKNTAMNREEDNGREKRSDERVSYAVPFDGLMVEVVSRYDRGEAQ